MVFVKGVQKIDEVIAARGRTTRGLNNVLVVAATSAGDDLHVLIGSMPTLQNYRASAADTAELRVSNKILIYACCKLTEKRNFNEPRCFDSKEKVLRLYQCISLVGCGLED